MTADSTNAARMPAGHGLTDAQLATLRDVLVPYAGRIAQVGLFGSRATGTFRTDSDVDLVFYGTLDGTDIDRLWTLFDSAKLALRVDVVGYDQITYPPLRAHIDAVMRPLFTGSDLQDAASFGEKPPPT